MAQEINLVPEIAEEEIKKGVYKRKGNLVAIVSLLVVIAITLGFFGVELLLFGWSEKIDSDTKTAKEEILDQKATDITHRSLVDKLQKAADFLSSRVSYTLGFSTLVDILENSDTVLKESDFASNGIVTVTGEAASSTQLGKILEMFSTSSTFSAARVSSLTGGAGKPYTFTVDFRFNKKGLAQEQKKAGQ